MVPHRALFHTTTDMMTVILRIDVKSNSQPFPGDYSVVFAKLFVFNHRKVCTDDLADWDCLAQGLPLLGVRGTSGPRNLDKTRLGVEDNGNRTNRDLQPP